jgi:hypothetical protein
MADVAYLAGTGLLMLVAGIYCAVRAVWDWRSKRVGLVVVSTALAVVLLLVSASILLTPVETHAVMIDLPRP